jgi:ribosomal protein L40E
MSDSLPAEVKTCQRCGQVNSAWATECGRCEGRFSAMETAPAPEEAVERFTFEYWKGTGGHHLVEDPEGEYVKYDDYEWLLGEVKRLRGERGEFICTRCHLRHSEQEKIDAGF